MPRDRRPSRQQLTLLEETRGSLVTPARPLDPFQAFADRWYRYLRLRDSAPPDALELGVFCKANHVVQHPSADGQALAISVSVADWTFTAQGSDLRAALDQLATTVTHGPTGGVRAAPTVDDMTALAQRERQRPLAERAIRAAHRYFAARRRDTGRPGGRAVVTHIDRWHAEAIGVETVPRMTLRALLHRVDAVTATYRADLELGLSTERLPGEALIATQEDIEIVEQWRVDRNRDDIEAMRAEVFRHFEVRKADYEANVAAGTPFDLTDLDLHYASALGVEYEPGMTIEDLFTAIHRRTDPDYTDPRRAAPLDESTSSPPLRVRAQAIGSPTDSIERRPAVNLQTPLRGRGSSTDR